MLTEFFIASINDLLDISNNKRTGIRKD